MTGATPRHHPLSARIRVQTDAYAAETVSCWFGRAHLHHAYERPWRAESTG
jgi:hypothetical protein